MNIFGKIWKSKLWLLITIVLLAAINWVASQYHTRIDFTNEKRFTLSSPTKKVLQKLDDVVQVDVFLKGNFPSGFKKLANSTNEMLNEFKEVAGKKLLYRFISPDENVEGTDIAWADTLGSLGFYPINLTSQIKEGQQQQNIYPVAFVHYKDNIAPVMIYQGKTKAITYPEINSAEAMMEFNFVSAIDKVTKEEKPMVGYLVGNGEPPIGSYVTYDLVENVLRPNYNLNKVNINNPFITDSFKVLIIVKPSMPFCDEAKLKLDQFVMRGGRLLVFEDPYSQSDVPATDPQNPMAAMMADHGSSLNKLTAKWGVEMDAKKAVADMKLAAKVNVGDGNVKPFVLWPNIGRGQLNPDDISTNKLETLIFPWAGSLNISKVDGVQSDVLIHTSTQSQLIEENQYKFNGGEPDALLRAFMPSGAEKVIAVRLRGKLQSNFPDGLKKKDDAAAAQGTEPSLKESSGNANVVIVSDVDFLVERFSVQVQQIFGTKIAQLINDNLNFFQNITENLLGSENLISIRSRGQFARPFTKVEELETFAQQRWQQEEMALQAELNGTNARLTELQSKVGAEGSSKQVLNKVFLDEVKKFKERKLEAQDKLRTVRRNLRQDIEHLGTLLFLVNTFMVPLALILGTILYSALKKR